MTLPRLCATLLVLATLAACSEPPRSMGGTATSDQNGRIAPTPQTTAPR